MDISDILEHWASIYKPLSHRPDSERIEDRSFFNVRYIDLENVFSRNANVIHSPCLLQSVAVTGEVVDAKKAVVSHQVWFLSKLKDTQQTLGRFSGTQLKRASNDLVEHCEQLVAWLIEMRRTGVCPITGRSFANDPRLMTELKNIDISSFSFGVVPELYSGQWLIAGLDWKSFRPLYSFQCGMNGKYIVPEDNGSKE